VSSAGNLFNSLAIADCSKTGV